MSDRSVTMLTIGLVAALLAFSFGFACFSAHQESSTYNRLTGAHTTWWDALWVELRIQDSPK